MENGGALPHVNDAQKHGLLGNAAVLPFLFDQ